MPPPLSHRLLSGAVVGAVLLSALPQRSFVGWSGAVATAMWAPLWPITSLLAIVRDRVRAPDEPHPGLPSALRQSLEDRDRVQGELDAARLRVRQLEAELGEIAAYRPSRDAGWRPLAATVVARSAGRPPGLFAIDAGSDQGVQPGDPVVVGGNRLLGIVAAGGAGDRSLVVPLDDRRAGRIDAIAQPSAPAGAPIPAGVFVQLVPAGNGRLVGELESEATVRPGDPVLLSDAAWKPSAQGMRVGVVERVGKLDSNPLRTRIDVRMETEPARVGRVIVKVAAGQGARP
ncbi:MAG: rod shape-determining protein MreC [Phycisphaerales bacterium]|jgi:cell shape-determining protein MreC